MLELIDKMSSLMHSFSSIYETTRSQPCFLSDDEEIKLPTESEESSPELRSSTSTIDRTSTIGGMPSESLLALIQDTDFDFEEFYVSTSDD